MLWIHPRLDELTLGFITERNDKRQSQFLNLRDRTTLMRVGVCIYFSSGGGWSLEFPHKGLVETGPFTLCSLMEKVHNLPV